MKSTSASPYDAICLLFYGGPEGKDQIDPFLDRVLCGKRIPESRRIQVYQRYADLNGISPLPDHSRRLIEQIRSEIPDFPIFWGNLYSEPFLQETADQIERSGIRDLLVFAASPFDTPSARDRYISAFESVIGSSGIRRDYFEPFYLNPLYLRAESDLFLRTLAEDLLSVEDWSDPDERLILFSAHSIPQSEADQSGYCDQIRDHCEQLIRLTNTDLPWSIGYQSRSGDPRTPWTGPSIEEIVRQYKKNHPGFRHLIVHPCGFFLENMETVSDLDRDLAALCKDLGIAMRRVPCAGNCARSVQMILEKIGKERE